MLAVGAWGMFVGYAAGGITGLIVGLGARWLIHLWKNPDD